jgi:hypothetical protein
MKTFTSDQIRAIVLNPSMLTRQTMMRIGDVTGHIQVGKIEKCELYIRQAASGLITNEVAADKIVEILEA